MHVIGAVSRLAPATLRGVKMTLRRNGKISLSRLARAAHSDTAALATSISLLVDASGEMVIEDELRSQIVGGIREKCKTAIGFLQAIDDHLGAKTK